ncbi:MAG: patatin-like phospholipase family protein [Bordetella sp.]|uniref:patatin-like phospholipase family protein n=1 Tax=Bordetella sp. TaxID=28081 RepID=UPI003F7C97E3
MPRMPVDTVGLLLTGGGARAAYQVGVLEAIADLRLAARVNEPGSPFGVITGTSAGAINAAALATHADDFDHSVRRLVDVWKNFRPSQIYRTDALWSIKVRGGRWRVSFGLKWLFSFWRQKQPTSMLDSTPLAELLEHMVPLHRLPGLMEAGWLRALAVSASSYSTGENYIFYQSNDAIEPWIRSRRVAIPGRITQAHLLASSAIPFVFPIVGIPTQGGQVEYFGDGSIRQVAPLSPAIHLGAQRLLAIGASRLHEPQNVPRPNIHTGYPTLAQVAGHAISSIFLDALAVDIERMQRINQTLALIPASQRAGTTLRPVELLVISPSERIDVIASRHTKALPELLRRMLGHLSSSGPSGNEAVKASALASYLLFDAGFTRELMELGRADTMRQRDAVRAFFGWTE